MPQFKSLPPDVRLLEPGDVLGKDGVDERVTCLIGVLAGSTRVRVLFALLEAEKLSVGELTKAVKMSDSATSHHLRVLRDLGLIRRRLEGRRTYYAFSDEHMGVLLRESLYHVDHARLLERKRV